MERMPFGRHRGRLLTELASDYLQWLMENVDRKDVFDAAKRELARRRGIEEQPVIHDDTTDRRNAGVIKKWFAELAMKYHPDRGGSVEAMRVVNDAHERLKKLLQLEE